MIEISENFLKYLYTITFYISKSMIYESEKNKLFENKEKPTEKYTLRSSDKYNIYIYFFFFNRNYS